MATWNYRVIQQDTSIGRTWSLHEVYYDEDGTVMGWTEDPVSFSSDIGLEDLVGSLRMALDDAARRPVLVSPEVGDRGVTGVR